MEAAEEEIMPPEESTDSFAASSMLVLLAENWVCVKRKGIYDIYTKYIYIILLCILHYVYFFMEYNTYIYIYMRVSMNSSMPLFLLREAMKSKRIPRQCRTMVVTLAMAVSNEDVHAGLPMLLKTSMV